MRRVATTVGATALLIAGLAQPAMARRSVTVRVAVHLKSDYTHTIDFTDDSDPSCVLTKRGTSHVVADMPSDRPSVYTITRLGKGKGLLFSKHLGGAQREDPGVDMHVDMTRSQDAGGTTTCDGFQPFSSDGCNTYSWIISGEPHFVIEHGHPRLYLVPQETVDTLDKLNADDKWRQLECGYVADADSYISQTYNETGKVQKGYFVGLSLRRLFAATPAHLTLHAQTSFTLCCPSNFNGGWTEVRTATVTIRKLSG
jgi:hypothetical protein